VASLVLEEAIILAASEKWAIDNTIIDKPMLGFGTYTLLDLQLKYLIDYGFKHIVIASDKRYDIHPHYLSKVEYSLESFPLGTGGAVLSAMEKIHSNVFYVMNVDDIVLGWNPQLIQFPEAEAKILVTKPKLAYGKVELKREIVTNFKEKPILDMYVSCGHYVFKRHIVNRYFPDIGNFEDIALPILAKKRKLIAERLTGTWYTIDNVKTYQHVRDIIESL